MVKLRDIAIAQTSRKRDASERALRCEVRRRSACTVVGRSRQALVTAGSRDAIASRYGVLGRPRLESVDGLFRFLVREPDRQGFRGEGRGWRIDRRPEQARLLQRLRRYRDDRVPPRWPLLIEQGDDPLTKRVAQGVCMRARACTLPTRLGARRSRLDGLLHGKDTRRLSRSSSSWTDAGGVEPARAVHSRLATSIRVALQAQSALGRH